MTQNLTKRQRQIMDFITEFTDKKGYAPSLREIGDRFRLTSPATIHVHVENLKEKGFLKISPGKARSIEIMPLEAEFTRGFELPLLGLVTAGEPIEAVEEKEAIFVPAGLVDDRTEAYALKVKGESMRDDGILDGDYVILERKSSPGNGETVVALLDNTYATLKKFYREKGRIRLQPANSKMKPIYARDVAVQGVVRAVIRKYA